MRRKGELSPADIDRGSPYQIVLPARGCEGDCCSRDSRLLQDLTLCPRGHSVFDEEWFHVYWFEKLDGAERFKLRFGGERIDRAKRGRGRNWARWKRA